MAMCSATTWSYRNGVLMGNWLEDRTVNALGSTTASATTLAAAADANNDRFSSVSHNDYVTIGHDAVHAAVHMTRVLPRGTPELSRALLFDHSAKHKGKPYDTAYTTSYGIRKSEGELREKVAKRASIRGTILDETVNSRLTNYMSTTKAAFNEDHSILQADYQEIKTEHRRKCHDSLKVDDSVMNMKLRK